MVSGRPRSFGWEGAGVPARTRSYFFSAACAAARRAIGTRKGEQDT